MKGTTCPPLLSAEARARAPGTCGELVQGMLNGRHFLITCPVDLWTEIGVSGTRPGEAAGEYYPKLERAVGMCLKKWGFKGKRLHFQRCSQLPVGKGMGSSTADIAAACAAAAKYLNMKLTVEEIAQIALRIEPTDGLMFPGVVLFDHREGKICINLGNPPPIKIAVIDPGGAVDTVKFNRRADLVKLNKRKEALVRRAVQMVISGFKRGDPEEIARGATLSAVANQEILPKPQLPRVLKLAGEVGALGVNVAHSGTVMGLLVNGCGLDVREIAAYIRLKEPGWKVICTRMIPGGVR